MLVWLGEKPVHHLSFLLVGCLIGGAGAALAFVPAVVPNWINRYYALIGMKTRVAPEDYTKPQVRIAGVVIIAAVVWVICRVMIYGR